MLDTWQIFGWQRFTITLQSYRFVSYSFNFLIGWLSFVLYTEIPQEREFGRNTLWNCGTETWAWQLSAAVVFRRKRIFFINIQLYPFTPVDRSYICTSFESTRRPQCKTWLTHYPPHWVHLWKPMAYLYDTEVSQSAIHLACVRKV